MPSRPPFGFNVMGCASGNFGEAVVLRNTIRALLAGGHAVAVRNFETGDGRSGQDHTYEDLYINANREQPYAINLFGFGPLTLKTLVQRQWLTVPFEKRINVMLPNWELDVLPPSWVEGFEMMDVALASTEFVAEVVRTALPDLPLMRVYTAVYLPDDIAPDRARWGLAEDDTVFFSAFDVTSDMRRKNPWAGIRAFQQAFPAGGGDRVRLLVKLSNARVDPAYIGLVDELDEIAAADPRITLIEEQLAYRDVLCLYASSDVFVSLHRAEGLGLVLMEAMSLGKPVIATAYSGTMDFTTEENAALVDFELIPVDALHHAYQDAQTGGGARWAEPSVDHAAEWMARLAADPQLRERIGRQAAADMDARREVHLKGDVFMQLEEFARTYDLSGAEHVRRARKLKAMRRAAALKLPLRAVRRAARGLVRALTPRRA